MGLKEETPEKRARFPTSKVCLPRAEWNQQKWRPTQHEESEEQIYTRLDWVSLHNPKPTGRTCHGAITATVVRNGSTAAAPLSACSEAELDYGGGEGSLPGPVGVEAALAIAQLEWRRSPSFDCDCKHPMSPTEL